MSLPDELRPATMDLDPKTGRIIELEVDLERAIGRLLAAAARIEELEAEVESLMASTAGWTETAAAERALADRLGEVLIGHTVAHPGFGRLKAEALVAWREARSS